MRNFKYSFLAAPFTAGSFADHAAPTTVLIERLINSGKPLEAWEAIQGLPPRLKFTTQAMRQRLRCAILLGWTRRAEMLEEVISTMPGEGGTMAKVRKPASLLIPSQALR